MGIYLDPEHTNFRDTLKRRIYVDKTEMISVINRYMDEDNKYLCVSRPRRFGKTIAGNMLSAYYSMGCDSKELFSGLKIAKDPSFLSKLNRYHVIKIDLNYEYQTVNNKNNLIRWITKEIRDELIPAFPDVKISEEDSLAKCIMRIYSATGEQFVLLIDEYDVLIREEVGEDLFSEYLSFLNGLFKSDTLRPAIALAYLTGIMPIVRDKVQSKLNNFEEYTILDAAELAEFVGFTDEEVQQLCKDYGVSYTECRHWYDGYRQRGYEIYNPESVVKCIERGMFQSYWGKTSTYRVIADNIRRDFEGTKEDVIRMLSGEEIPVAVNLFMNRLDAFHSKDDLFTYLLHIGYLAYNNENGTCCIPNKEVRGEWLGVMKSEKEYATTNSIIEASRDLLAATVSGDEEAVAKALDKSHIHIASNRSYHNEDVLQSAIYLAFIYALNDYTCIREMTAGKGFSDVVYIPVHPGNPNHPAMIIELKRNDSAESAITQIKNKEYFASLLHYKGNLLFIGINYDEKKKTHTCRIERFEKN